MNKQQLKRLINTAAGRTPADLVIKNCKVVDVYNASIIIGDIAVTGGFIAGVGSYEGEQVLDAGGKYAAPSFIDSHIHIESSFVSPEELGRLLVPCGTSTIIADPHEIVNVAGIQGMDYMLRASERTALDIKYMLPSCVPATPFEHAGADINAAAMTAPLKDERILGLGEFMNYVGVTGADDEILDKLMTAYAEGKLIDGHSPGLSGSLLNAYAAARIRTDHECRTVEEMLDRLSRGMYVLLRQGSACHDLVPLLKGLTTQNSRRCLLCSDDRQPRTIFEQGHLDDHLRICVREGVDPITAIQMASLNTAECFCLEDRGAIAPGLRADITLMEDLTGFQVTDVFLAGVPSAKNGNYLPAVTREDITPVKGHFHVKDFSMEKLSLKLKTPRAHVIDILPGGVVTGKGIAEVAMDAGGQFQYDQALPIAKVAVVERHQETGNVAVALLRNYGIKSGAIALSIAHDSHNIITVGTNDADMAFAVEQLLAQNGGVILVKDQKVLESMPLPIGGIMSDQSGRWVEEKLTAIHNTAFHELGISSDVEPVMTLCFMSLPVIPELKLTDMGLFDVTQFQFIPVDAG